MTDRRPKARWRRIITAAGISVAVAAGGGQAQSAGTSDMTPRSCHAMTYVPGAAGAGRVVVIGGAKACGVEVVPDSAVWTWNGTRWASEAGVLSGRREDALVAFDQRRGALVLYGGRVDGTVYRDTWERSGAAWRERGTSDAPNPGPLEHAAAAYDERRGRVVVFGGGSRDGRMFDATWEWDGSIWRQAAAKGPAARVGHSMAWSAADSAVVMYGGFNAAGPLDDLWKWNGDAWTRLDSAGPASTEGPALVASDGGVMLVGPRPNAGADAALGVWMWRRGRWTPLSAGDAGPRLRVGQGVAYDAVRRRLVLFGGFFPATNRTSAEVWEFDGARWQLVAGGP